MTEAGLPTLATITDRHGPMEEMREAISHVTLYYSYHVIRSLSEDAHRTGEYANFYRMICAYAYTHGLEPIEYLRRYLEDYHGPETYTGS